MSCSAVINPVLTLVFLFLDAIFISCYMKLNNMAWAAKDEIFDLVKARMAQAKEIRMGVSVEILDENVNVMICRPEFGFGRTRSLGYIRQSLEQ